MNTLTKLSIAAASIVSLSSIFAGSAFAQTYYTGVASWTNPGDAKCYQVYYKEKGATNWQNSVHCKDTKNKTCYPINYLKSGVTYTYSVKEVRNIDNGNKYPWIKSETTLPNQSILSAGSQCNQ